MRIFGSNEKDIEEKSFIVQNARSTLYINKITLMLGPPKYS